MKHGNELKVSIYVSPLFPLSFNQDHQAGWLPELLPGWGF